MNLLSSFKKHVARLMSLSMMAWSLCGLVTLTGALLTYALWQQAKHEDTRKLRSTLEYSADVTVKNILNRLNAYQVMMRGVKGHIDGSDYVTADEFRDYIASLRLDTQAGLKGVALVTLVKHQDKERHIAEKRKQGYPGYTIFPEGIRDFYTPITAIEPLDEENIKALGFDTWTGTSPREAMERSRDDNDIRITSHFTLIQDQEKSNSHAFVMYLPIFKKGAPLNTLAERREAITGWVDAPFRINDLIAGLRGEVDPDVRFEIHDSGKLTNASHLYQSTDSEYSYKNTSNSIQTVRQLKIAGSQWTILFNTTSAFEKRILPHKRPLLIALTGSLLTTLLGLLTWFLVKSFQQADARYQKLFDLASDGVLVLKCDHSFLEANNAALQMLGYERETLLKMRMHDILSKQDHSRLAPSVKKVMTGKSLHEECTFIRSNSEEFPVEVSCQKLENDSYFLNVRDLTERKKTEMRISRLTKLYSALSEVNQAIVRMDDESGLFPLVCQCAVEFGGMKMAWIGQLDQATSKILPVAKYGSGVEYLDQIALSILKDSPDGQGPTGTALRENQIIIINDYLSNPKTKRWHERAAKFGWESAATFPIQRGGKPFAVLTVYHTVAQGFDDESINLLTELTSDISFALDNFDHETERINLTHDLENAYERINHIINVSPSVIYSLKIRPEHDEMVVDFISDSIYKLTGYPLEDWYTPQFWLNHVHPDDHATVLAAQQRLLMEGMVNHQYRFLHANGNTLWVDDQLMLIRDESGKPVEAVGTWLDVTSRKIAEENLRVNAQVFEFSREGIITTDADNKILSVNKAFTEITGYAPEEIIGKNPRMLASGTMTKDFYRQMWQQINELGYWQGEVLNRRKDGEFFSERLSISTVRNQDGKITQYIGIISDLSEHKLAEQRIEFLSNFDPLTQLPNRNLLSDRAKLALAAAKRSNTSLALMYVDLDRFKIVNESLGLSVGDALLKELAKRLLNALRPEDTLSRQGGDEFIIMMPNTDAEGAAHVAKKILETISRPFNFAEQRITLTSSIGIAEFPQDGDDFEQLAQAADAALYRAKQAGRNNFQFFTQQMHEQAYEVLQIENELRLALENNQFRLYYQPQVDAVTAEIVGIEALIRWQHPKKGLVSPASFIPIAEETSLINEIGNWVLITALKQLAEWQNAGIKIVPVAINLSIVQFRQDTLYQAVCDALRETKLPPSMLELEMTESIAMEDSQRTVRILKQLNALGVSLSIDDFGTGYSSLSYLKKFSVDKLKIDQSFVRDMEFHPEDTSIITAIIGMAKGLGFKTIAEGVETKQQLEFLQQSQCDQIQGYLFSTPLPAEDFVQLLRLGKLQPHQA